MKTLMNFWGCLFIAGLTGCSCDIRPLDIAADGSASQMTVTDTSSATTAFPDPPVQSKVVSANVPEARPVLPTKSEPLPMVRPPSLSMAAPSVQAPNPHTWERYLAKPATELSYWNLASTTSTAAKLEYIGGVFADALFAERSRWSKPKRNPSAVEKLFDEYEQIYEDEYYFVRLPKFRAPVSGTPEATYTWYFAVSPQFTASETPNKISATAKSIKIGPVQSLAAGEAGEGSDTIFIIPRSEVQAAWGYWNEKVTVQIGLLEVDVSESRKSDSSIDKIVKRQFVKTLELDFYNAEKDRVQEGRLIWKAQGEKGAAVDYQYWKGSWTTNRR